MEYQKQVDEENNGGPVNQQHFHHQADKPTLSRSQLDQIKLEQLADRPQPTGCCTAVSLCGFTFSLFAMANSTLGLYCLFLQTQEKKLFPPQQQDLIYLDVALLLFSLKWLTSLIIAVGFAFLTLCVAQSFCNASVPIFMFLVTVQQIAASSLGFWWIYQSQEEPQKLVRLNRELDTMVWYYLAGEAVAGLWSLGQLIGILVCSHEQSRHLREIRFSESSVDLSQAGKKDEISNSQIQEIRKEIEMSRKRSMA